MSGLISPVPGIISSISTGCDEYSFVKALKSSIRVNYSQLISVGSDDDKKRQISRGCFGLVVEIYSTLHPTVTPYQLVARWVVGLQTTKDAILATTQLGTRAAMEISGVESEVQINLVGNNHVHGYTSR